MKRYTPRLMQLWVLLLCSAMVGAQTAPPPSTQRITPNFQNVDITVVAEAVGAATGITFIPDPRVRANVTLINPQPMTPQQLYYAFLSILAVNNLSAQRAGNIVKIVPDAVARTMPGNDLPANYNMGADESVTAVLDVKNISSNSVAAALRQLVSQAGTMIPVPGTNSIVITDRASNVARIQKILSRVDQASNASYDVIPLKNAVATEVAKQLGSLFTTTPADAAGGGTPAPKVIPDDRTNSVFVSGDPGQRLRIAALIDSLDAEVNNGGGTQVIALKYATADDLATTLKAHITGVAATTTATPGGAGAAGVAAAADRSVTIQPDKLTNKLIITAPPRTMLSLTKIIDELDIPPLQVHIEAIIAEVTDTRAASLGVNWAVFSNKEGSIVPAGGFVSPVGGTSIVDLAQIARDPAAALAGGVAVPLGATFAMGQLRDNGLNLGVILRALRSDGTSNIISYPNVTAKNNEEAVMTSGQKVPFLTGQYTNTNGGGTGGGVGSPFQTLEREPVGTTFKVTPQIIPGNDEVILTIDMENSALSGDSGDGGSPITSSNSVKTAVRVRNGETIVIGGMIKNSNDNSESRVPFLGRIPLLGELFRTRGGRQQKSSIMIFIQPRILVDSAQAGAETNARWNEIRDLQRLQNNHKEILPLLPFDNRPELPPLPTPEPTVTPTQPPLPKQP